MRDYKAVVEDKRTGERTIHYAGMNGLPEFKTLIKSIYPEHRIVSAKVNRDTSVMVYDKRRKKR